MKKSEGPKKEMRTDQGANEGGVAKESHKDCNWKLLRMHLKETDSHGLITRDDRVSISITN